MNLESCLKYYSQYGVITDPGAYKEVLLEFPIDIYDLCQYIHTKLRIDFLVNMGLVTAPHEHLSDSNIRNVETKLAKIKERNGTELLGNCRDLSLMMCSVLRTHGIPARVRSGFATFFHPAKFFDHWVCEYFCMSDNRWIKVDPWMSQIHYMKEALPPQLAEGLLKLSYDPYDVGDEYFMTGGQAWINYREKGHNPDKYGTYDDDLKGNWFIRDNMLRDLLCLNKVEPLPWDCWGIMGRANKDIDNEELTILDDTAKYLQEEAFTLDTLKTKIENLGIQEDILKSL